VLGLLKVGEPRFVIYSYGQTFASGMSSVISSGPLAGLCTNSQITAENRLRAVVPRSKFGGSSRDAKSPGFAPALPARLVVESYHPLPPD